MSAGTGPVPAVYELPRPIWISADVLGTRHLTYIGPVQATIAVPPGPTEWDPPQLDGLPAESLSKLQCGPRLTHLDQYPDNATALDPTWTTAFAAQHQVPATALRVIGLELNENSDIPLHNDLRSAVGNVVRSSTYSPQGNPHARVADVTGRHIEAWFARLAEWVNVLTGQDLDHHHQIYDSRRTGPGLRTWFHDAWHPTSYQLSIPTVVPIEHQDWASALNHVGALRRPALEWQLVVHAARAVNRGYNRRALTEYATAVEVCLTRLTNETDSTSNKPNSRSTLPKWSEWLEKHCDSYDEEPGFRAFVELRNDCVHRAYDPTNDDIHAAAACASAIVTKHGLARTDPQP